MANTIIPKRSSVAAKVPLATDLQVGEIAVNLADAKIYSKNASGTVIQLGGGTGTVAGPGTVTDAALSVFDGTTGNLLKAAGVYYNSASGVLQFGGKTNTYTGLRNNASVLEARWADNSGYADFRCGGLTAGAISNSSWFNFNNYFAMNSISGNIYMANGGGLGWSSGLAVSPTSSYDVYMTRDGSSTISVLGAAAASFNVYNSYTNGTTYERGVLSWSSNVFKIGTQRGSSGTARSVAIITDGTDRVTVDSVGRVGINTTPGTDINLAIGGTFASDGGGSYPVRVNGTVPSTSTAYVSFDSIPSTAAASFTMGSLYHFRAGSVTLGSGSAITSQIGFHATSSLTGATNNYGFYSNIASGTGRWNFYAAGTADNYFAGRVGIGGTPNAGSTLHLAKAITGATTSYGLLNNNVVQSDVTADAQYYNAVGNTAAAAFTLPTLRGYYYRQATFGAGSAVTNQYGFFAESDVIGATNNYGFYSNIASGTGRWNFYANGTADNYFAGNLGLGVAPIQRLNVYGNNVNTGYTVSNISGTMNVTDTTTPSAIGVGGRIVFGSTYWTGGSTVGTAYIGSYKENAPSNGTDEYNHSLVFGVSGYPSGFIERARINSSGYLLVGYTSSNGSYRLQVNSQIFATSSTIATSDRNYKTDVVPLSGSLALVNKLNPVHFKWKPHPIHEFNTEIPTLGFLAQEVQDALADEPFVDSLIKESECELPDGTQEKFLGIAEGNMIALLTSAIKELSARLDAVESRLQ